MTNDTNDDGAYELATISLEEMDTITMAATVDVSELSIPEKKHLVEKAHHYEDDLLATVDSETQTWRRHDDDMEKLNMGATIDISELSMSKKKLLYDKANAYENDVINSTARLQHRHEG